MTAPEQPGLRNPVTSPTSGNDLRDRIAEALNHAFAYVTASGQGTTTGFVAWTDFADAVMAVVQPELDRRDREIKKWQRVADGCERAVTLAEKRAEAAEAERDALRDRVLAYADQLHGYCSPHGISAIYADQLREVVNQRNGDQP